MAIRISVRRILHAAAFLGVEDESFAVHTLIQLLGRVGSSRFGAWHGVGTPELAPARATFLTSYAEGKKKNRFTKVQMDLEADAVLQKYFSDHHDRIQGWFNVISPVTENLTTLQEQLSILRAKNWQSIHTDE